MTRKPKERLAHATNLPNALANGKRAPLVDRLDEKRLREIRELILKAQIDTVVPMMRGSVDIIKYVTMLLKDDNRIMRQNAAWALGEAAKKGMDISTAISALGNALMNEDVYSRDFAASALADAAGRVDISSAIPQLGNALRDEDADVRQHAAQALALAAWNANETTRELITRTVYELQESKWFIAHVNSNTVIYEKLINALNKIMLAVRAAEKSERTA